MRRCGRSRHAWVFRDAKGGESSHGDFGGQDNIRGISPKPLTSAHADSRAIQRHRFSPGRVRDFPLRFSSEPWMPRSPPRNTALRELGMNESEDHNDTKSYRHPAEARQVDSTYSCIRRLGECCRKPTAGRPATQSTEIAPRVECNPQSPPSTTTIPTGHSQAQTPHGPGCARDQANHRRIPANGCR